MLRSASDREIVLEIALSFLVVAAGTAFVGYSPSTLARDYGHLVLAALFLGTMLYQARRQRLTAHHYGSDLAGVLEPRLTASGRPEPLNRALRRALPALVRELGWALGCAAVVFPPFVVGFRFWHDVERPFTLHLPTPLVDYVLGQVVVIALPEEALFRGYFQTRLSELFPKHTALFGAQVSLSAWLGQAGLFAVLHYLVGFAPARLAVFFPALLFGWLRARRGGIGAAVWLHALSNLLSEVLVRGYL